MKKRSDNRSVNTGWDVLKKFGILILNFFVFFGILQLIILLSEKLGQMWIYYAGMAAYGISIGVLLVIFYVWNGFTFEGKEKTEDDLSDDWDRTKKTEYLAELKIKRKKAKNLIYFILPLVITVAVYYIEINFLG